MSRKGLLVVGDIRALVVGSANAVVREEVLGRASAHALQLCIEMTWMTYRVTGVSTGGGAVVWAKLRTGLKLSAAEGLAKSWCERVGVDLDSRVSALGGNEAREGRSGKDNGGVEHGDDEVWRWRSDRRVSSSAKWLHTKEQAGRARWQGCCSVSASMLTWLFVEREWGINGRDAASCGWRDWSVKMK